MTANLKPYTKLLRIVDTRGYFLMALFGFLLAKGYSFPLNDIFAFWTIILSFLAFGFSINDCFDQKEDGLDKTKSNPIVSKEIGFARATAFSLSFALIGLLISAFYGWTVFLLCLFGVLLTFFYSSPPVRFKSRPPFDVIFHGLFAGALIFFLAFFLFNVRLTLLHYLVAFAIFYFSIVLQLRNEFEDYEIDKTAGLQTSAHVLGRGRAGKLLRYLAILYPFSLLPIFNLFFPSGLFSFFLLTLFFLFLFLFAERHRLVKNYKLLDFYGIFSLALIFLKTF